MRSNLIAYFSIFWHMLIIKFNQFKLYAFLLHILVKKGQVSQIWLMNIKNKVYKWGSPNPSAFLCQLSLEATSFHVAHRAKTSWYRIGIGWKWCYDSPTRICEIMSAMKIISRTRSINHLHCRARTGLGFAGWLSPFDETDDGGWFIAAIIASSGRRDHDATSFLIRLIIGWRPYFSSLAMLNSDCELSGTLTISLSVEVASAWVVVFLEPNIDEEYSVIAITDAVVDICQN